MKQNPTIGLLLVSGMSAFAVVSVTHSQNPAPVAPLPSGKQSPAAISCFAQIKERVLAENPRLKRESATLRSLRFQAQQAALLPNPVISFEAENFAGSRSEDDMEYTGALSQLIETAGKRGKRTSLAMANAEAFAIRREIAKAEVLAEARVRYAEVLAAKSRLALSEREVSIRRKAKRIISRKSSHGGALRLEVERADVSLQTAEVARNRRLQELTVAKRSLASLWGSERWDLTYAGHELGLNDPEFELAAADSQASPDVGYALAQRKAATKSAELQRALAIPDLTVSAGYRRFEATDDHAFVADISIPLPLFDRNQFAVKRADEKLNASQFDVNNTRIAVTAELESRRDRLRLLLRERKLLQQSLLPQTERVLASATEAYRLGRIDYLDYLDAQTTYLERRERLVTVTLSAIRNQIAIQRLNGTLLERISQMDQGECHAQ